MSDPIYQPNSEEIEDALLGSIIMDPTAIESVKPYIPEPEVFYYPKARAVWIVVLDMYNRGDTIDFATVINEIPADKKLDAGAYYVTGLVQDIPTAANAEVYAKKLYEKWLLRRVVLHAKKIEQISSRRTSKAHKILEEVHSEISEILMLRPGKTFDLDKLLTQTKKNMFDTTNIIRFGLGALDAKTGGMTRGEITIVAGRPGHFKTTMVANLIRNLIHSGQKVLVFNREMTNVEMMKKLIVLESGSLSYQKVRMGTYTEEESKIVEDTTDRISQIYSNLIMFDDIIDMDSAVRELRKHKPDVVVDDYIQLVSVPSVENRRLQIDYILRQYKWAIKAEKTVAILVSQLSRACEQRINKRPIPSDLRESGAIEQDAEMVLFNYYDFRYNPRESEHGEFGLELIIGKHRYGTTGNILVGVHGDGCRICETVEHAERLAYEC